MPTRCTAPTLRRRRARKSPISSRKPMKENLLGLDAAGLERFFETQGEKRFRARQVLRWVHQRGEGEFERMSDLARGLREKLAATARIEAPVIVGDTAAADGTRKW